jgi:hypothetical protein
MDLGCRLFIYFLAASPALLFLLVGNVDIVGSVLLCLCFLSELSWNVYAVCGPQLLVLLSQTTHGQYIRSCLALL